MKFIEHCKNAAFTFPMVVAVMMYITGLCIGKEHPLALGWLLFGTFVFGAIATWVWHIDKEYIERKVRK